MHLLFIFIYFFLNLDILSTIKYVMILWYVKKK